MTRAWRTFAVALGLAASLLILPTPAQASSPRYCDDELDPDATQKDRLFRMAAVIKTELERSGQRVALMSRSGLDLARFGQRYSHAGLSLRANDEIPWAVRQLYYACSEKRPRIFDQGLSGFLLGTSDPAIGYVSVVFLPDAMAQPLERVALDRQQALALLSPVYSANAYPYSVRYQNCNQWVVEMLAAAWGGGSANTRERAQQWLIERQYEPTVFDAGNRLTMWLATAFVSWLHGDDHPPADQRDAIYRTSMPASIEAFVRQQAPDATRIEFCHNERHMVIHRGWTDIAEGCTPAEGDTVIAFDTPGEIKAPW